jgi:hypothetical protein
VPVGGPRPGRLGTDRRSNGAPARAPSTCHTESSQSGPRCPHRPGSLSPATVSFRLRGRGPGKCSRFHRWPSRS